MESNHPRVSAVVVARDRAGSLAELLEALANQSRRPDQILIVDNDSSEEVRATIDRARHEDDSIDVLRLSRNHGGAGGFSAGIAQLARRSDLSYLWVFDDDAVPERGCLAALLAQHDGLLHLGAVGAASCDESGELAWSLNVEGRREPIRSLAELYEIARGETALAVMELAWHALLIPVAAVRAVGPPRADLFTWYEDVEYGLRLRSAGLRLYVVPAARVRHPAPPRTVRVRLPRVSLEVPVTDATKSYLLIRNSLVVRYAYAGLRFWYVDLPLTMVRAVLLAFALPRPRPRVLRHVLVRAVTDAARGRMGAPPARTVQLDGDY